MCLGVWLWVCTQTYGTSKHRAPGVNFHGSVPGSVGRWVIEATESYVKTGYWPVGHREPLKT